MSLRSVGLAVLCLTLIASTSHSQLQPAAGQPGSANLVVHEWGTFTSIVAEDGLPITWHPLRPRDDLPGFVYGRGGAGRAGTQNNPEYKGNYTGTVRMETPVMYFYSDQQVVASVHVKFARGLITEWYPSASSPGQSISWSKVLISPGTPARFRVEREDSHYYHARSTDAVPLIVKNQAPERERFLFYRGVGHGDLPVKVGLVGNAVTLSSRQEIGPVFLVESRGGKIGFATLPKLEDKGTIERPDLVATRESVEASIERTLIESGLFPKEAAAMIRTWSDSWFHDGTRIFYVMPRSETDEVLPLTIVPQPSAVERVMVARTEIITPETVADIRAAVEGATPTKPLSEEALAVLRRYRRFVEPVLVRVLGGSDTERHLWLVSAIEKDAR